MKSKRQTRGARRQPETRGKTIGFVTFDRAEGGMVEIGVRAVDFGSDYVESERREAHLTLVVGPLSANIWLESREVAALSTLLAGAVRQLKPGARFPRRER